MGFFRRRPLAILCLVLLVSCANRGGKGEMARKKPLLLSVYYTWYATADGPHGVWAGWQSASEGLLAPDGCDPSRIVRSPDIRDISSCAYPLIGLYDSTDPEVVRWHIRLAKAVGVDAFLADWQGKKFRLPPEPRRVPGSGRTDE
jgi:hypothetical protein